MRDIFYGRDIPAIFPKPDYWPDMSNVEPDEIYTISEFNYRNNHVYFTQCKWLKPDPDAEVRE
jgi:hypothetical protein